MGDIDEVLEGTGKDVRRDTETKGCDGGRHSILQIVRSLQGKLIDGELELMIVEVQAHHIVIRLVRCRAHLRIGQEGERLHGHGLMSHDIAGDELVFTPVDEGILCGLIL